MLIGLRTRELLKQLLEARCRLSPVVMVIEDLHWIDSASEEVLGKIVDSEAKLRLLMLTYPPAGTHAGLARSHRGHEPAVWSLSRPTTFVAWSRRGSESRRCPKRWRDR